MTIKDGNCSSAFPLAHKHEKLGDNRQHQTDITNSSQKYSHMVGASTDIVNTGTLPAHTFGPHECDTWRITEITMGQSGFTRK